VGDSSGAGRRYLTFDVYGGLFATSGVLKATLSLLQRVKPKTLTRKLLINSQISFCVCRLALPLPLLQELYWIESDVNMLG
jgi:hypothetical protein